MTAQTTTLKEIEKLALGVAKKAQEKDTSLRDQIDALKALHPLFALLVKKEPPEDKHDEPTMAAIAREIDELDNTRVVNGGSATGSVQTRN